MIYVLHYISKIGSFLVLYGLLMLILHYTLGWIPYIKKTTVYGVPLELLIFSLIAFMFIAKYVYIGSSYEHMLRK